MHLTSRPVSIDVIYSPKNTEVGTHKARVSVGQTKTQNTACTMKSVTDVEACHPTMTVATQTVHTTTATTSRIRTSVCVNIHAAWAFSGLYLCVELGLRVCVREFTSILSTLFPISHL